MIGPVDKRIEIAKRIAARYALHEEVEAVALIGSVARGWADAYSDIEISVFWRTEPGEDLKAAIAYEAGGVNRHIDVYSSEIQAWCESYDVDGIKIDLGHWLTSTMDTIVSDVVERYETALSRQTSVSAMLSAIAMYGVGTIERWQHQARVYPDGLAVAMVRENLTFSPAWMLRMLAERGDFPLLRRNLSALTYKYFSILCGLNRVYYPGHKWLPTHLKAMSITPQNCCDRLDAALTAPLQQAVSEFEALIDEINALVAEHNPG